MGRSLIVIMCLLSFVGTLCAQQNAPRSYVADGKTITYRNGIDKLLNHFPGDHVLTLSERDSDARDFILKHFPRSNPSVVHADFDGDGHPDYAMLLRDNKSGTTKFVVLLRSGITQYKSVYELDVTPVSGEVYIRPLPIGSRVSQTEEIDTKDYPSPVQLSSTGIELT